MRISFRGADQGVTGSCHLLEALGQKILIDCGLFQGSRTLATDNADDFGFDPATIDAVVLTHAHLDHCGRLPLLVKRGFRGRIHTTDATRDLAAIVLKDSAHLQGDEAERNREDPLYTLDDAIDALDLMRHPMRYGVPVDLAPGLRCTLYDAGHILGSASARFEITEQGVTRSVVFSGDLGSLGRPLLHDPVVPPVSDVVIMECTYGDRLHRSLDASVAELYTAIRGALERGGNIVIPTFALERAQEILYYLHTGCADGHLPPTLQVFLDSPMAIAATELFRAHPEALSPAAAATFASGSDPLSVAGLALTRDREASQKISRVPGGAVILAGSGMATGGRVTYHLMRELPRAESAVIFVGFAAIGTPARRIIDGAEFVRLHRESIPVRASIHTINGFSAHADRDELLAWHAQVRARRTFLVHGEITAMQAFAARLPPGQIDLPKFGDSFEL